MSADEDGFLGRWSRRKAAVRDGAEVVDPDPNIPPAESAPVEDDLREPVSEDETLPVEDLAAKYELPNPETLEREDQVPRFLAEGVPERLRRLALRRAWRLNPVLANVDGLVEYGEDYTDAANVVADLITTYRVGKGAAPDPDPEPDSELGPEQEAAGAEQVSSTQDTWNSRNSAISDTETEPPIGCPELSGESEPETTETPPEPIPEPTLEPAPVRRKRMVFTRPGDPNSAG